MTLPASGTMLFSAIKKEFNGATDDNSISKYYRGGSLVPNNDINKKISTSGKIAYSMFYGARNELDFKGIIQAAWDGRLAFSRWPFPDYKAGQNAATNFPDGWFQNDTLFRETNPIVITAQFDNAGWDSTEKGCTIALVHSGGIASSNILNSVQNNSGGSVGFTRLGRYRSSTNQNNGWAFPGYWGNSKKYWATTCIEVYTCNVDRNQIASLQATFNGTVYNSGHAVSIFVFPGKLQVINSIQHINTSGGAYINVDEGEILINANEYARETWESFVSGAPNRISAGGVWYNTTSVNVLYGLSNHTARFTDKASLAVKLRKLAKDQVAQDFDGLSTSVTMTTTLNAYGFVMQGSAGLVADAFLFNLSGSPAREGVVTGSGYVTDTDVPNGLVEIATTTMGVVVTPDLNNATVRSWAPTKAADGKKNFFIKGRVYITTASGKEGWQDFNVTGSVEAIDEPQTGG